MPIAKKKAAPKRSLSSRPAVSASKGKKSAPAVKKTVIKKTAPKKVFVTKATVKKASASKPAASKPTKSKPTKAISKSRAGTKPAVTKPVVTKSAAKRVTAPVKKNAPAVVTKPSTLKSFPSKTSKSSVTKAPAAPSKEVNVKPSKKAVPAPLEKKGILVAIPGTPRPERVKSSIPFVRPPELMNLGVDESADPGTLPSGEVFDETDYAQMLQLQEQASISHRARQLNRPEEHPDFDGQHCVECDAEIPPARLALHKVRCVHCQSFLEEDRLRTQRTFGQ